MDDALDDPLEVGGVRIEEVRLREVVEGGPGLPPHVRVGDPAAALEEAVLLLLEDRDPVGALGEGPAGEPAEEQGEALQLPVLAPLAQREVLDRLEVVDGRGAGAEVEVQDAVVARLGVQVRLDVLHHAGEDDGEEGGVGEGSVRGLVHAARPAVRPHRVGHRAHEDVVLVEQPLQEGADGGELDRVPAAAAQAGQELSAGAVHVLEVVHGQEDRLEEREDLVLHPAQALLRRDWLDLEEAVALAAALFPRVPHGHDPLPLPLDREDGVDRRVDPQAGLLQVVLDAVEDEGPVGGVRLDDRGLERQPRPAAEGTRLLLAGVAHRDVDAGQALVELVAGRHLAHHEAEVVDEARGDHRGGEVEGETGRHPLEEDRGEGRQEVAVLRRGLPRQDLRHLREPGGTLLGIALDHVTLLLSGTSGFRDPNRAPGRSRDARGC